MFKWLLGLFGASAVTAKSAPVVVRAVTKFKNENAYNDIIQDASRAYNIPVSVIKSIIAVESGFNPNAKATTTSASGLMQVTAAAAQQVGVNHKNIFDPRTNIFAGTKYLRWLIDAYGFSLNEGIQAYYAGGGSVNNYKKRGIQNQFYPYSVTYLGKVSAYKSGFNSAGIA